MDWQRLLRVSRAVFRVCPFVNIGRDDFRIGFFLGRKKHCQVQGRRKARRSGNTSHRATRVSRRMSGGGGQGARGLLSLSGIRRAWDAVRPFMSTEKIKWWKARFPHWPPKDATPPLAIEPFGKQFFVYHARKHVQAFGDPRAPCSADLRPEWVQDDRQREMGLFGGSEASSGSVVGAAGGVSSIGLLGGMAQRDMTAAVLA